ncbi:bifunctional hydroxymethylpyrimidine kinase/phosphomethylpyrimidine kinase [Gilvimarinus agarilyticus]|uniref:bifunctional hydroxymethylpyrimidine kinase/phosphomethylpyrimidine kinase n=1 Tax=Gilvimarinus agarilyticus TaxID=679259 RepID=UPI00059F3400|nr:bifunctional hydroxymethylpyrimidine kinase/phosphomethylpyrimidine kinase [Gilvimarinus agarilyticus]
MPIPPPSARITPIALTVAGSDSGGGAGIQADLKTFAALGVYGTSVLSALTAQNTQGVQGVMPVPADFVSAQLESVLSDMPVGAIKTGMLADTSCIKAVAAALSHVSAPLVVDPVMVATSGDRLLPASAASAVRDVLLPLAHLVTPNIPEAAVLLGVDEATCIDDMRQQAESLLAFGPHAVLLKGGHLSTDEAVDVYCDARGCQLLRAPRVATRNTHGTGCTLAAAACARLALGDSAECAARYAKSYLHKALCHADELSVGAGAGPVNHFYFHSPQEV